jgi:PAS domain S-box-containing protein
MGQLNFARLQAVIQNMSAGVVSTDAERRIVWANDAFLRLTGYALDEVIGRRPLELLLDPAADPAIGEAVRARLSDGAAFEIDVPLRRKDGSLRWLHMTTQPIFDPQGHCVEYVALMADITERRDAEEALRQSNALLEATQSIAGVGGWALDVPGGRLYWSAETYRLHETSPEAYQPSVSTAIAFYAPESVPLIEAAVARAIETGEGYELELELVTARGRRLWVHTTGRVVREAGRTVRVIGAIRDVTSRRIADAALRASESRLRSMVDNAPMGIMLTTTDGRLSYINDALLRLCGLTLAQAQQAGSVLTIHPDDLGRLARGWRERRGSGLPYASAGRYLRPDGSVAWWEATTAPIVVDDNLAAHVVMVLDVTEQLALEREVAEAVGREQDRLGMELHDGLGQELTGLAISLESLVRQAEAGGHPLRKDMRELADLASQSVAMCRQIAQGLAPMQLARGGLRNALRSLSASARSLYGVRMRCRVRGLGDQDLPSNTAHQIYRISQEAISNAIRHGQATQIDLRVIRDGDRLQLLVQDNGRGMMEAPAADGMGLHTMRYRAKMIGAELDVGPAAGTGVRVRCSLRLGTAGGAGTGAAVR